MKRQSKRKNVTAILTSDWHLSEKPPKCRTETPEEWLTTMATKLEFISKLQYKYDCAVYHAGDLFDHWKPSPFLLSWVMKRMPKKFTTILGNHDIPFHFIGGYQKCGVRVLAESGHVQLDENGLHWEDDLINRVQDFPWFMAHIMTYKGKEPWPGCEDLNTKEMLEHFPNADLIVTGHNHSAFTDNIGKRRLVNPGSIFRLTADQIDHKPRVYLWDIDTNSIELVYLPIQEGRVTRHHLEEDQAKNDRIKKFMDNLEATWEPQFSLEKNLEIAIKKNKIPKRVANLIWEAIG